MIRKFLQKILTGPVVRFADRFSSSPDRTLVFDALDKLYDHIHRKNGEKGLVLQCDPLKDKFVVLSDQHKGAKNGADDFMICESTYVSALAHYDQQQFHYICLGDCEELWENNLSAVRAANKISLQQECAFIKRNAFTKVFGNHDLYWAQDPFAALQLKSMYGPTVKIYEGVVLKLLLKDKPLDIFLTHGHQGDKQSDGNWFSKFFVSRIWGPLQSYLRINPNTPAYNSQLKTIHNTFMYEWSSRQENLLLITGHTHQPVFESLTLLENLVKSLDEARVAQDAARVQSLEAEIRERKVELPVAPDLYNKIKPSYFNSGCCCYSDGDITGIEIEGSCIRLVKWKTETSGCTRTVLRERDLEKLIG